MKNVLLLASHGIAEYDDTRMFSDAGYDVFTPGGYADPAHPGETLRPGLPDAPQHPEFASLCEIQRQKHGDASFAVDWAKADLHPDLIDWADAIIVHHYPIPWIAGQWPRLRGKRVIWRTCGQSDPDLERFMAALRRQGLQIVRYSPKERNMPDFAGEDALIRFGKYPSDYGPWIGDEAVVGNVSQWRGGDDPLGRADALNLAFWQAATDVISSRPAGPGSEALPGGLGALPYPAMIEYLRHIRAYLYTGTRPAPYTLGLIEAMLSGVPVVSIGAEAWGIPELFEGGEIAPLRENDPAQARRWLEQFLADREAARVVGALCRIKAVELFGIETISRQWQAFLGVRSEVTA